MLWNFLKFSLIFKVFMYNLYINSSKIIFWVGHWLNLFLLFWMLIKLITLRTSNPTPTQSKLQPPHLMWCNWGRLRWLSVVRLWGAAHVGSGVNCRQTFAAYVLPFAWFTHESGSVVVRCFENGVLYCVPTSRGSHPFIINFIYF